MSLVCATHLAKAGHRYSYPPCCPPLLQIESTPEQMNYEESQDAKMILRLRNIIQTAVYRCSCCVYCQVGRDFLWETCHFTTSTTVLQALLKYIYCTATTTKTREPLLLILQGCCVEILDGMTRKTDRDPFKLK